MWQPGLLLYLFTFWQTVQPLLDELAGKVIPFAGRTARGWNYLLKRGREADASRAMNALTSLGPEARLAVPTLKEVFLHGPPWQRRNASLALGQMGQHFPEAVDVLYDGMKNPNMTIRRSAYDGLSRLDASALQRLVPDLLTQIDEQPFRFRRNLLDVLEQADLRPDKHLPILQKMLTHDRSEVQKLAVACFRKTPRQATFVPLLEPLVKDGGSEVRSRTVQVLCLYAGEGKASPAYLVQGIQSDEEEVRQAALEGLLTLGEKARHLESELLTALEQTTDGPERLAVAEALWRCCRHPKGKAMVLHLFQESSFGLRLQAAQVLATVGPGEESTLRCLRELLTGKDARMDRLPTKPFLLQQDAIFPLLDDALRDERALVRLKVLDILREMPNPQRPRAVRLLLRTCRTDTLPTLQYRAALILWGLDHHPAALDYLALLLQDESIAQNLRRLGLMQLPVQGPLAERMVPHLLAALKAREANLREWAVERLAGCTVQLNDVTDALSVCLADKDPDVREGAARVLRTLGPTARRAVPDLWRRLEDATPSVQKEALLSLAALHPEPAKLLPHVLRLLGHYDNGVQAAALEVLATLKPARQDALTDLRTLLRERDVDPRRKALLLISRMELADVEAAELVGPLLSDPDDEIRSLAITMLGRRSELPPELHARLRQMYFQEEGRSRLAAALAVWKQDRHPLALAVLRNGLKDRSPDSCIYALDCLGQIGPDACGAAPLIEPLLRKALQQLATEAHVP